MKEEEEEEKKKSAKAAKKNKKKKAEQKEEPNKVPDETCDQEEIESYVNRNWEAVKDSRYYRAFFEVSNLEEGLTLSTESMFEKKKKGSKKKKKQEAVLEPERQPLLSAVCNEPIKNQRNLLQNA